MVIPISARKPHTLPYAATTVGRLTDISPPFMPIKNDAKGGENGLVFLYANKGVAKEGTRGP